MGKQRAVAEGRLRQIYERGIGRGRDFRRWGIGLEDEIQLPYSSEGFAVGRRSGIEMWQRGWWKGFMEGDNDEKADVPIPGSARRTRQR